jgi:hypothetical protein
MKQRLIKAATGTGGIALCALFAHGVSFILAPRGPLGLSSGLLGVLVTLLGLQLRRTTKWQLSDFLFSLAGAEVVAALVAALLSLLPPADGWRWFARTTLFIAPPWILGYGLGTVSLLAAERQKPVFVRSWIVAAVYTLCGVTALVLIPDLRHAYGQFAAPLPRLTLFLIRMSPELWFFLALGFGACAVSKDLVFRQKWLNLISPIPLVPLTLALFLPLL